MDRQTENHTHSHIQTRMIAILTRLPWVKVIHRRHNLWHSGSCLARFAPTKARSLECLPKFKSKSLYPTRLFNSTPCNVYIIQQRSYKSQSDSISQRQRCPLSANYLLAPTNLGLLDKFLLMSFATNVPRMSLVEYKQKNLLAPLAAIVLYPKITCSLPGIIFLLLCN